MHVTPDLDLACLSAQTAPERGPLRVLVAEPVGEVQVEASAVGGEPVEANRVESAKVLSGLTEPPDGEG